MALQYATEPRGARDLIQAGLASAAERPGHLAQRAVDAAAADLTVPHPVYDLRADAIASGAGLTAATPSGFRYLVIHGGAPVAAAEVSTDDDRATLLTQLNYGPYVEATQRQLTALEQASEVQGSYEVRLLRCAAVFLMAVWLRPGQGGADLLYPLDPAPPGLEPGRQYSEEAFFAALRPLAERRVSKEDSATLP